MGLSRGLDLFAGLRDHGSEELNYDSSVIVLPYFHYFAKMGIIPLWVKKLTIKAIIARGIMSLLT